MDYLRDKSAGTIIMLSDMGLLPDYAGNEPRLEAEELEKLASVAFADPIRREHPIHTKGAAWLSAAWLAGAGDRGPAFEKAAAMVDAYGGSEDLDPVLALFDSQQEKKASEPRYALGVDLGEGEHKYYPINNSFEVEKAARQLSRDTKKLPQDYFREAARNIVKAASDFGVPEVRLPSSVREAGVQRMMTLERVPVGLYQRKEAGVDIEPYEEAVKLASEFGQFDEAIEFWRDADYGYGIEGKVDDPEAIFMSGPPLEDFEKAASEHAVLCGVVFPAGELDRLAEDDFKTVRRYYVKEAAEKVVEVLDAPRGEFTARAAELPEWSQKRLLELLAK